MDEEENEIKIPITINKKPHTFRELIYIGIIIILMIGFAAVVHISKLQIQEYYQPYIECTQKLNYATNGYIADTTIKGIENMTPIETTYK